MIAGRDAAFRWQHWPWWPWEWWPWCVQLGRCRPTAILIRHADVTAGAGADPSLNAAGLARAEELRHVLGVADVGAIFVTSFQRTQQTAAPLAADLGIVPAVIDDVTSVLDAVRALPASEVALVVGHTNTLPDIATGLGATILPIGATEFDNMFLICHRRLTHLRYGA
jgi:broad specificity phosphatase PhoE